MKMNKTRLQFMTPTKRLIEHDEEIRLSGVQDLTQLSQKKSFKRKRASRQQSH
jgi:hypothetical protein